MGVREGRFKSTPRKDRRRLNGKITNCGLAFTWDIRVRERIMHQLYATAGSGNCFKPQLLMAQLGIPWQTIWVDVLLGENRRPAFLAMNPAGTVPFLRLDAGDEIAESNAMLWALAQDSALLPTHPVEQAMIVQWMIFEQTRLEPFLSPARFFTTILPGKTAEKAMEIDAWREKAEKGMARLEGHLRDHDFLVAGRYSIADIALYGYVHVADEAGLDFCAYPAIAEWCGRVRQTPGYIGMMSLAEAA